MKGQGRVYRPKVRGEATGVWWLDYSVNGRRYRESSETAVKAEAVLLLPQRIEDRKAGRPVRDRVQATLAAFARLHLTAKEKAAAPVTDGWIAESKHHLDRAIAHFGGTRPLASVTATDVREWSERLRADGLGGGTIRHHLNALSNLYKRARAERAVPSGYNPVADLLEKPTWDGEEARWLEVPDAAVFLKAARTAPTERTANGMSPITFGYPLIATFLLTGGRQREVLGLEVADVDFDRKMITFRPNAWRRLKTRRSHRSVRLWPQLERVLREYVFGGKGPPARLLFPSFRTGDERMLTDMRKLLDRVTEHAGAIYLVDRGRRRKAEPGDIRTKVFRHTYITARLQTLDHGAPVSPWAVAREVGHSSTSMIEQVYGHLGKVRHRSEVVEYRIDRRWDKLGSRPEPTRSERTANKQANIGPAQDHREATKSLQHQHKRQ